MSQASWYEKLKSYVPSWVFEEEEKSEAIFQGLAAVLDRVDGDYRQHILETQIDNSSEEYLKQMGKERGIFQLTGEPISAYRQRVKEIVNRSNCPLIKAIVDSIIINGESIIVEHDNFGLYYMNRAAYLNRGLLPTELLYNAYTVFVPDQTPQPVTFLSRESFLSREETLGSSESSILLFQHIVEALNINKGFGTVYRLYEQ